MARKQQVSVENNFTKGLVTEKHALQFPENACTEALNVIVDNKGRITRRPGIDMETGAGFFGSSVLSTDKFSEYLWSNATGSGDLSILVQQQGSKLYFFKVEPGAAPSTNKYASFIELNDHIPSSGPLLPAEFLCSYAQGRGNLLVTNKAIDPIYITLNTNDETFSATTIDIMFRDFKGAEDGLGLTERLTTDIATLKVTNPEHYYNLLNQGWHAVDALSQWDTARTDVPSNSDVFSLYRASETDSFDNARVLAKTPGNTPAPKGHFILSAFNPNRTQAMIDEGFTGAAFAETPELITAGFSSSNFDTGTSNNSAVYDSVLNTINTSCYRGSAGDITIKTGRIFSYPAKRISQATVYGSNNFGFSSTAGSKSVTINLYGSHDVGPYGDPVLLGTSTFADGSDESAGRTITNTNEPDTFWYQVWVEVTIATLGGADRISVAEVEFYSYAPNTNTDTVLERPSQVTFFASRAVFAGIDSRSLNNHIFFSQIIEKDSQYGECYQVNDPTSEDFADLLPSDGGVVVIPEMSRVTALFAYQSSLLVFASNGIWLLVGTSGNGFRATDYTVKKISSLGCNSPKSIVDYRGIPVWFGEDGIYTVKYDANYDSFTVVPLTDESIKSFYQEIPVERRNEAKGAYDTLEGVLYWLYREDVDGEDADEQAYNRILAYRPSGQAFWPYSIERRDDELLSPRIRGIVYAYDNDREASAKLKFTLRASDSLSYAEFKPTVHADWSNYATDVSADPDDKLSYDSYFVTGYRHHADTIRYFQPNYVFVFLTQEPYAACSLRSLYEYTTKSSLGHWSTSQQLYASFFSANTEARDVIVRRMKIRGKGRVMQFKFNSVEDKPFSLLGWAVQESQNSGI